jgi:maltose/moltooligosaccharide transporter
MIIQNVTFGYILKHFLMILATITFAGVLLMISAICTLFIKQKTKN